MFNGISFFIILDENNFMDKSFLNDIVSVDFPDSQYYRVKHPKKQVVIHHTASGKGVNGDFTSWLSNPQRIATCLIIDREGVIHQCYSSSFWGHHLGVKQSFLKAYDFADWYNRNTKLNQESIAVELDAWGGLEYREGKFYAWPNNFEQEVEPNAICLYESGYRGYLAYERYTDKQIETLRNLLLLWNERYSIPLDYKEDMWDVSRDALSGEPGVWSHVSYRNDKSDCHPQPELINMLKNLKPKVWEKNLKTRS